MKKRFFHHPVGIFPAGARWYLASIATLSLLCVAMHMSIQIHAQKQAETVVKQWGEAADIQVENVHYHLLRNALILQQIHVIRGEEFVFMEHMLLRSNPTLLTSHNPQIGRVEVTGLEVALSYAGIRHTWQQDEPLQRLWQAVKSVQLEDGTLTFHPQSKAGPPLEFTGLSLRKQTKGQQSMLSATASLEGAPVHWQWQTNETESTAAGKLGWRHVDAGLVAASFGLRPTKGALTGYLNWTPGSHPEAGPQASSMEGRMELDDGESSDHQLLWQGSEHAGIWKMDISARAWPLDAWAKSLPHLNKRVLVSGQLDGALLLNGSPETINIRSSNGELKKLVYRQENNNDSPAWQLGSIQYRNLSIDTAHHQLVASEILLADSTITLQTERLPSSGQSESMEQASDWLIDIADIQVENLNLGLSLEQGVVDITMLGGSSSRSADGLLEFDLQSIPNSQVESDGTLSEETPPATAFWQLRGELSQPAGKPAEAMFHLSARYVPIARLRPLVPLTDATRKSLSMAGNAALELDVSVEGDNWQTRGSVSANDLHLALGSDILEIGSLAMTLRQVGMALPTQEIERLDIDGWHYITALNPLPPASTSPADKSTAVEHRPAWWTELLLSHNWHINSVILLDGSISLGHEDSHWLEQLDLRFDHIGADKGIDVEALGRLGEGRVSLIGLWKPLARPEHFTGKVSLNDALPFFLRTWMNISGMPEPLRGRLSAELSVADTDTAGSYMASLRIQLLRGLTSLGVFPQDPLLSRVGFSTTDTINLLSRGTGMTELAIELAGEWQHTPLTLERIGLAIQSSLQERLRTREHQGYGLDAEPVNDDILLETQIRLHGNDALSLNERTRLRKVLRTLRGSKGRVVDLVPNWAGLEMNSELLGRIQRTQQLIGQYLAYRGIRRKRIFPIWPSTGNQIKGIGSISVVVRQPQSSPE